MLRIIALTKERIKKFNLLGCDVSIGFAKYGCLIKGLKFLSFNTYQQIIEDINCLLDHTEEDGLITHRLILWRFKLEVKSVVEYCYAFKGEI